MRSERLNRIRRYYQRGYHYGYKAGLRRAGVTEATIELLLKELK